MFLTTIGIIAIIAIFLLPSYAIGQVETSLFEDVIVKDILVQDRIFVQEVCSIPTGKCYTLDALAESQVPQIGSLSSIRCPPGFDSAKNIPSGTFICFRSETSSTFTVSEMPNIMVEASPLPDKEPRPLIIQEEPFEFLTPQQETDYRDWYDQFENEYEDREKACKGQDIENPSSSNCKNKIKRLAWLDFELTKFEDRHFP